MDGQAFGVHAQSTEIGIEKITLSVGPEASTSHPVRPRREEGNTVEPCFATVLECSRVGQRKVENILAVDLQFVGSIAYRWGNRNFDVVQLVFQVDHFHSVISGALCGVGRGCLKGQGTAE